MQKQQAQSVLNNSQISGTFITNQPKTHFMNQTQINTVQLGPQTSRMLRRVASTAQVSAQRINLNQQQNCNLNQPTLLQGQKGNINVLRSGQKGETLKQNLMDGGTNGAIQGILLSEYVKDTKFNPNREISKERNISEFFQQKYLLLNEYLSDNNEDQIMKNSSGFPLRQNINFNLQKQSQNSNYQMKRSSSQPDFYGNSLNQVLQIQNATNRERGVPKTHYQLPKSRTDQVIEQIEKQVVNQVEREWKHKSDIEAEQQELQQKLLRITGNSQTYNDNRKRRIQMFVDPRSQRIRVNFQVLNKNLNEIKKLDPKMELLQNITNRNRLQSGQSETKISMRQSIEKLNFKDWKQKSNAEILNEILKIGRK